MLIELAQDPLKRGNSGLAFDSRLQNVEFKKVCLNYLIVVCKSRLLESQQLLILEHASTILEKSTLSYNSVKSIMASLRRLCAINIENIFTYRSISEINNMCTRLNTLK